MPREREKEKLLNSENWTLSSRRYLYALEYELNGIFGMMRQVKALEAEVTSTTKILADLTRPSRRLRKPRKKE